jgi:hypothetical protein
MVPDRQQIEQGRRHREAGEADEHHGDHGVPDEVHVTPQGRYDIFVFHQGLTLPRRARCRATLMYPQRINRPIFSTLNFPSNAADVRMAAMIAAGAALWRTRWAARYVAVAIGIRGRLWPLTAAAAPPRNSPVAIGAR